MERHRILEILAAERKNIRAYEFERALAEAGIYVFGPSPVCPEDAEVRRSPLEPRPEAIFSARDMRPSADGPERAPLCDEPPQDVKSADLP